MKKHEIIFSILKLPLDFGLIMGAFFMAREIRLITDLIPSIDLPIQTISTPLLTYYALSGAILYIFLFTLHGLYNSKITQSKVKEFIDIIQYSVYWFLFFSVGIFFLQGVFINHGNEIPRLIILFTCIIGGFSIIIERILLNALQYILLKKGFLAKKQLLLITNKPLYDIKYIIQDIEKAGIYIIKGYINSSQIPHKDIPFEYLGSLPEYKHLLEKKQVDEVLYIESDYIDQDMYNLWKYTRIFGIRYRSVAHPLDNKNSHNTSLSLMYQVPLLEVHNTPLGIWGRVCKRTIDIIISLIGMSVLSPMFIIIALLIKYDDPNAPVIYKNKRIGQKGKKFNLYKFRYIDWQYCIKESYGIDNTQDNALEYEKTLIEKQSSRTGPLYKIKDDPRKTSIGTFIEKYSIDELPQLFNVFLGNMSIVGPRPHQPREVQHYRLWEKQVLTIKPGITGMAQVHGREKNVFEEEAKMDIFYIENWSLLLDLKLLLKTFSILKR